MSYFFKRFNRQLQKKTEKDYTRVIERGAKLADIKFKVKWDPVEHGYAVVDDRFLTVKGGEIQLCTISETVFPCQRRDYLILPSKWKHRPVTGIGKRACSSLAVENLTLPHTLKNIGEEAFYRSALITVNIPDGVKQLKKYTFANCSILKKVEIGKGLEEFDPLAFIGCSSLEEIIVSKENKHFKTVDGVLYSADGKELLYYPGGKKDKTFAVPDGVEKISPTAFCTAEDYDFLYIHDSEGKLAGCIVLPKTVTEIPDGAFKGYWKLNEIFMPGVTKIGKNAFDGCRSLKAVHMPAINTIGVEAFRDCGFETLELPNGLYKVEEGAFAYCANLTKISVPDSVSYMGKAMFGGELESLKEFYNNARDYFYKKDKSHYQENLDKFKKDYESGKLFKESLCPKLKTVVCSTPERVALWDEKWNAVEGVEIVYRSRLTAAKGGKTLAPDVGEGPYLFVSYAHADADKVMPYVEALQKAGVKVWYDEGIRAGSEWADEIIQHLYNCTWFAFFVSEKSLRSVNCQDELHQARELNKTFINVLVEDFDFRCEEFRWFEFRYARYQMIPAYGMDVDRAVEKIKSGLN